MRKYLVTCTFYYSAMDAVKNKNLHEKQFVVECVPENIITESYMMVKRDNPTLENSVLYHFLITNLFQL